MKLFGSKASGVRVTVFGKTDVGRTRDHNEDCFIVADLTAQQASLQPEVREHELGPRGTLLCVAVGMGGAAAGEVASKMASDTIYEHMVSSWSNDTENTPQQFAYRLKEAVEAANYLDMWIMRLHTPYSIFCNACCSANNEKTPLFIMERPKDRMIERGGIEAETRDCLAK